MELADAAGVGLSTVRNFEKGRHTPIQANMAAMMQVLQQAGVLFLSAQDGLGAGVRFAAGAETRGPETLPTPSPLAVPGPVTQGDATALAEEPMTEVKAAVADLQRIVRRAIATGVADGLDYTSRTQAAVRAILLARPDMSAGGALAAVERWRDD